MDRQDAFSGTKEVSEGLGFDSVTGSAATSRAGSKASPAPWR